MPKKSIVVSSRAATALPLLIIITAVVSPSMGAAALTKAINPNVQIVIVGETHTFIPILQDEINSIPDLKKLGFTHIGIEMPVFLQPFIDNLKPGIISQKKFAAKVYDRFLEETSQADKCTIDLIEAAKSQNIKVAAIDSPKETYQRLFAAMQIAGYLPPTDHPLYYVFKNFRHLEKLPNLPASPKEAQAAVWKIRVNDRSKDMAQNIAGILKSQPDAKIIVFVGTFHAAPSAATSTNKEVENSIENLGIKNYLGKLNITNVQMLIYQNTGNLQLIEIH